MINRRQQLLELARKQGVLRSRDATEHGISTKYLTLLEREGQLERIERGIYVPVDAEPSDRHTLAEAAKRVPRGVICLLSALRFHEITTQQPFEIWMALEEKAWQPQVTYPPMRFVRFSGEAWAYGVEEHPVEGVPVRVYGPAKTVADCFKYRNKIGLDVALEALRDTWRQRRASMDELWRAAGVCRVQRVMQPYLESLT
jgi:predicted transcriptional regulator of viral defense system